MNDNHWPSIADERLLAAMKAVNPPVEKLMADRLALRQEMRQTRVFRMTSQLRLSRGSVQFQYLQGQKLLFSEINQPCASLQA